jgi:hypothetical protein
MAGPLSLPIQYAHWASQETVSANPVEHVHSSRYQRLLLNRPHRSHRSDRPPTRVVVLGT